MDIQTRKIEFVKEFLQVESEVIISHLEKLLRIETKSSTAGKLQPFTIEQLHCRIDQSLADSESGKLIEVDELITEIEKWG